MNNLTHSLVESSNIYELQKNLDSRHDELTSQEVQLTDK